MRKLPRALRDILESYTADRQPFLGKGATGETWGDTVQFLCYVEPIRHRTRSVDAETTRASCKLWTFIETEVEVGDWVAVGPWSGRVLSVAPFSSRGTIGTPDHKEVFVG